MHQPTEKTITANIIKNLKRWDHFYLKLHGGPFGRRGVPDLLVIVDGDPYFFEVKRPGNKPTKAQQFMLIRCRHAGAFARVVHSWTEVKAALEE